jgi:hypothetical protein
MEGNFHPFLLTVDDLRFQPPGRSTGLLDTNRFKPHFYYLANRDQPEAASNL